MSSSAAGFANLPDVLVYRMPKANYVPIVSFNIKNQKADETAQILAQKGFCLRAGLHCAPLAHYALQTIEEFQGSVRFAPAVFSDMINTNRLADAVSAMF